MAESLRLSPAPPERTSLDYAALRESGVEWIRQLAAESWTDHNVHDPGITVLEAFSYAMTELGFRNQLDMVDLLRSGEEHAPTGLVPAERVLPCGPVSPDDHRRLLLDHSLVGDALIAERDEGEIRFYEDPGNDPPFVHGSALPPGDPPPRARLFGLYEPLVAFAVTEGPLGETEDLNSNTYDLEVTVGTEDTLLDIALPHWDEDPAAPFRGGATVGGALMVDPGGEVWRRLAEPQTYFGELRIDYTLLGSPGTANLWIVLRIPGEARTSELAGILAAAQTAVELVGPATLTDRYARRVQAASDAGDRVDRYISGWRSLCEDPIRLSATREQEIGVGAHIEVTGGIDLESLLADIFLEIERDLSPPLKFYSLDALLESGKSVEEIFDGPSLRNGFLAEEELEAEVPAIYVSDVLRLIMRQRTSEGTDIVSQENPAGREIVSVSQLRLSNFVNNRPVTVDARDCLRLVETERYRPRLSLAKSRIVFTRDDVEVDYDRERVAELFAAGQAEDRAALLTSKPSSILDVPAGEALPIEDYVPFQSDLPSHYGVGEAGLPASAGATRRAQALQAQGYLHLFEQLLADSMAQLGSINRFFSPSAAETATYFTRPLFDVPGADQLIRRDPAIPWQSFVSDPDNQHSLALREAAENEERFLDRRNRMLDHLLARLGEQTVALGRELHRRAIKEVNEAGLPPATLTDALERRRRDVNRRLIDAKAAFLADVPELNALRLQAFGHVLHRRPEMAGLLPEPGGHRWTLELTSGVVLRSPVLDAPFVTEAQAVEAAEEALTLAVQSDFYDVVGPAGVRRYRLKVGPGAADRPVAESPQTFPTIAAARTASQRAAAAFTELRLEYSLTPMERRIAHLIGIRSQLRRRAMTPTTAFFSLSDTTVGDGVIDGWTLHELPGGSGADLLTSSTPFVEANDALAIAAAQRSIDETIRLGVDEWHYEITPAGEAFRVELPGLAEGPATVATLEEAELAVAARVEHLYRLYSGEGFHLVEHVLLRPREDGDPFLSLPMDETSRESDPYGHRLSLVFPSGYSRDFSAPPGPPALSATPPHRFRDPEFRRHADRTARDACPAHILPTIYWVDRDESTPPAPGSFEGFEARYFSWLEAVLIPGTPPATVRAARAALIQSLNSVAQG